MALDKIIGIVTDIVKHNDRSNVITLFTRSRGRIAFISPAGTGKRSRMRNARLMPLSVIEADINFQENKNLQVLGAITPAIVWKELYFNPAKTSIALFITEFLNKYLRDSSPDPISWDYIFNAIRNLDSRKYSAANFHLAFLIGFMQFAGITPDISDYEEGDYFDMNAGIAVPEPPIHHNFLNPQETKAMTVIMRMNLTNDRKFKFIANQRRLILAKILQYYSVHFPGMANLHSPDILSEVFS